MTCWSLCFRFERCVRLATVRCAKLESSDGECYDGAAVVQQPLRIFGDDAYPTWHPRPLPLDAPRARFIGFKPETILLKKGTIRREGAMPLPCDILLDRDVAVTLRDGVVICTYVFRPVADSAYPSIMCWSPYGKEIGSGQVEDMPCRSCVPMAAISELNKFEAVDPAFWVAQGYLVLKPDTRGTYKSGGNLVYWGRQLAEDGSDFIEWAAQQPWSRGEVGMAGNSFLAVSQWFTWSCGKIRARRIWRSPCRRSPDRAPPCGAFSPRLPSRRGGDSSGPSADVLMPANVSPATPDGHLSLSLSRNADMRQCAGLIYNDF